MKSTIEKITHYKGEHFKPNQKIICIDVGPIPRPAETDLIIYNDYGENLEIHNIYIVKSFYTNEKISKVQINVPKTTFNCDWGYFYPYRFLSIKNYRKLKLKKLNNEQI